MPVPDFTPYAGLLPSESDPATFPTRAQALFTWFVETGAPQLAALATYLDGLVDDDATVLDALETLQDGLGDLAGANVADLEQDQAAWNAGADTNERLISAAKLEAKIADRMNLTGDSPAFACRAWVVFGYDGANVVLYASRNVASVTRSSSGIYTITFEEELSTDYAVIGNALISDLGQPRIVHPYQTAAMLAGSCQVVVVDDQNGPYDVGRVSVVFF